MVYDPFGTKVDAKKALNICKYCVPSVLGKWYLGCEFANQQNYSKTVNLIFLQVEEDLLQLVPGILDKFVPDDKTTCDKKLFC